MSGSIVSILFVWITLWSASSENLDIVRDEDLRSNKDILESIPYPYQIVYPVQMRLNEVLADLDTRDYKSKAKNAHYHHTNFEIIMLDRRYKIKVEQNRELLSGGIKQKHDRDEKMQIVEGLSPENCYYQGQIRKLPESRVVISTCSGIRGLIFDLNKVYMIQPLREKMEANQTHSPHLVIEMPSNIVASCGNSHGMWQSYKSLHQREFLGNVKIMKPQEDDAFENVKYLHMAIVADQEMFNRLNETVSDSLQYFILLANIVDTLLKEFRIRVRLVYVEIWNHHDQFSVEDMARMTLTKFLDYRLRSMIHTEFDFVHFLTGHQLHDRVLGMAIPDSICSGRAVAISQETVLS